MTLRVQNGDNSFIAHIKIKQRERERLIIEKLVKARNSEEEG